MMVKEGVTLDQFLCCFKAFSRNHGTRVAVEFKAALCWRETCGIEFERPDSLYQHVRAVSRLGGHGGITRIQSMLAL